MKQLAIAFLFATSLISTGCGRVTARAISRAVIQRAIGKKAGETIGEKLHRQQQQKTKRIASSRFGRRVSSRRPDTGTFPPIGP